jgi:hypothetical protein
MMRGILIKKYFLSFLKNSYFDFFFVGSPYFLLESMIFLARLAASFLDIFTDTMLIPS